VFSVARWRLTVVFTAVLVILLVVSGVAIYFTTRSLIYHRVDAELQDKAQSETFLTNPGDHNGGPGDSAGPPGSGQFDPGGYFYAVANTSGTITSTSTNVDMQGLAPQATLAEALKNGSAVAQTSTSTGQPQRVYVLYHRDPDGTEALLEIGRSVAPEQSALSQLEMILMLVIGGSVIPALAGGYLLSGRALRPIKTSVDSQRAFVADASHELRTPVAVIRTNAELMEKHLQAGRLGQSPNDALAVEDILSETERLAKLVSQMLTLAQVDAGRSVVNPSPLSLDELAEEVGRSLRALAEAKQVTLDVNAETGIWVQGQRDRLREVIVTLVDNAIKYTSPGGRVELAVQHRHKKALLTVSDTGAGIPPESLAHIFERFYRVDKARSRDDGGTGLGLAIARHLVAAHHGDIKIESTVGVGTRVLVELRFLPHERQLDDNRLPRSAETQ
jgi:two-component system sensor histidine kinase CiaH